MLKKKFGFTLAEILITLGIVGVVAALTLPILISYHKKNIIESRLAKFYSAMNQAIALSESVNGPKEHWEILNHMKVETFTDGLLPEVWFNKYLRPYLIFHDIEINDTNKSVMVYFSDGSLAMIGAASVKFYPQAKDFKDFTISEDGTTKNATEISGIKYFTFMLGMASEVKRYGQGCSYNLGKGLEPYLCSWDGTREHLINDTNLGCNSNAKNERAYCTRLIQMNGWEIPNDYPLGI